MDKPIDPQCEAYQSAIDILCRPWTALILGVLQAGPLRFNELEERTLGLGAKTLSARLKTLEVRGILERRVETGPPIRVQYRLTPKGLAFNHVAAAIEAWGRELVAGESAGGGTPAKRKGHRKALSRR